jgi:hypothetical protein
VHARFVLGLTLLAPVWANAQSPGVAVPTALAVRHSGFGGCTGPLEFTPASSPFFPEVRFTRSRCVLEHGDPVTSIVGLDADSVLFLLASTDAFNFLVARHPPVRLDSTTLVSYALSALEFTGIISAGETLISKAEQLPSGARDSSWVKAGVLPVVRPEAGGQLWHVTLVTRAEPGHYQPVVRRHELRLARSGQIVAMESRSVWRDPTQM